MYTEKYAAWKENDEILIEKAKESILKVVSYPRGWLIDDEIDMSSEPDSHQSTQNYNLFV